jgi:hypothetical protein
VVRSEARRHLITPTLADVVAKHADNGLEAGMSAADMIPVAKAYLNCSSSSIFF